VNARLRELVEGMAEEAALRDNLVELQGRQLAAKDELIEMQRQLVEGLTAELEQVRQFVESLQAEVAKLRTQADKDSTNSSSPPSKDSIAAKARRKAQRTDTSQRGGRQTASPAGNPATRDRG
jgi:hypothetical protein